MPATRIAIAARLNSASTCSGFKFKDRVNLAIAQPMKRVGDQRQLTLPIRLCSIAAVSIPPAELFELVVQFSHSVLAFRLVFLTTPRP